MNRTKWRHKYLLSVCGVLSLSAACVVTTFAQTAPSAQQNSGEPMIKSPEAASGAAGSSNPDNMPIKRPTKPTNDKMMHAPPASGANAK
ncbi:hypothetical protein [Paraburkholderia sp. BCC1886]|uniref:hypothetical protein n=1 Tax=Paraburkholderia sp. BCC1886 TaxID=2562670 RepID=UPI001182E0B4|nr:hypothetical protein [Paraburkholderia sp. BCC1886]